MQLMNQVKQSIAYNKKWQEWNRCSYPAGPSSVIRGRRLLSFFGILAWTNPTSPSSPKSFSKFSHSSKSIALSSFNSGAETLKWLRALSNTPGT